MVGTFVQVLCVALTFGFLVCLLLSCYYVSLRKLTLAITLQGVALLQVAVSTAVHSVPRNGFTVEGIPASILAAALGVSLLFVAGHQSRMNN